MFIILLATTFVIAVVVSTVLAWLFRPPMISILKRIMVDDIYNAWVRYLIFALYVVSISSGVRIWDLERYIIPPDTEGADILVLTGDRWVLEVYRTVIGALQGAAWMLLVFFMVALIAFVIVRMAEMKRKDRATAGEEVRSSN